jgi:predicted acylesterase/phospholipase RssA/CRP-like cAMP-binding protein
MKKEFYDLVKQTTIFSSLPPAAIKLLIKKFAPIQLNKDKYLFKQSAISEGLYLLVSGKLISILHTTNHKRKILGEVKPGETVGELGALSGEPRAASIQAIENSMLLKLSSKEFKKVCIKYPKVSLSLSDIFIARSQGLIKQLSEVEPEKKHIVIVAGNPSISLNNFIEEIKKINQDEYKCKIITDILPEDLKLYSSESECLKIMYGYESKYNNILYFVNNSSSILSKVAFSLKQKIYIVGNKISEAFIEPLILDAISSKSSYYEIRPEFILLQEDEEFSNEITQWLKLSKFNLQHHVRLSVSKDLERIFRLMRGQGFGLVLGGGGLRSWAHLGVIRALVENNIPIDVIGGTSAGAIVAGHYALHQTFNEKPVDLVDLSEVSRKTVSIKNVTWPVVSIFDGKAYTQQLQKMFGDSKIESLWLPSFIVACNLSKNSQKIFKKGFLWRAIRASTAVPAIFPPVIIRHQIHLDGGILNNLPVDIMKKIIGNKGTVFAAELTHIAVDKTNYDFPPILPLGEMLLTKIKFKNKQYVFPQFIDNFLKSLLAGSSAKQEENSLLADVLITPDLSKFTLLNVKKNQQDELIKMGYEAALLAIKKWKRRRNHNHS